MSKYTKERLQDAAAACVSIAGVMRHFGLRNTGGSHARFKKLFAEHEIDTSHFYGQAANRGDNHRGGARKLRASEILVLGHWKDTPTRSDRLKRSLRENGRLETCEVCGCPPEWNGKPLVLQVDHINGKRWDNRPENIRWICPNCHTQTETFGSRNKSLDGGTGRRAGPRSR